MNTTVLVLWRYLKIVVMQDAVFFETEVFVGVTQNMRLVAGGLCNRVMAGDAFSVIACPSNCHLAAMNGVTSRSSLVIHHQCTICTHWNIPSLSWIP